MRQHLDLMIQDANWHVLLTSLPLTELSQSLLTLSKGYLQEEDVGGADILSMEEFGVLLQACHMAVAEAVAGTNPSLVPPDSLKSILRSIQHLLHPSCMKPSHCDLISCCDIASTIAGIVKQVNTLVALQPFLDSR